MLIQNRLKFFNKEGNNINPENRPNVSVEIIDPQGTGLNAQISLITNYDGQIEYVRVIEPGFNYSAETYLRFIDLTIENNIWDSPASALTIDISGAIQSFSIPNTIDNNDFTYPASFDFSNYFLPKVSTGLIESENIFIAEEVLDDEDEVTYVYPRINEYGPFNFIKQKSNSEVSVITIENYQISCKIEETSLNVIHISPLLAANITVGMSVVGAAILPGTSIVSVKPNIGEIVITSDALLYGNSISLNFHNPHYLKVGAKIRILSGDLAGTHEVTYISDLEIAFANDLVLAEANVNLTYNVIPSFEVIIGEGSDEEWFLYEVDYSGIYPTIVKSNSLIISFDNASLANVADEFIEYEGKLIRKVNDTLERKPLQINFGCQSSDEGIYTSAIEVRDITFSYSNQRFLYLLAEIEIESEDERLGLLLDNFGRNVTIDQELILRDSDVNESNPDYILLNQKRKEMLLQGEEIWPYVGSYKGLVNIINWFGYYDIRIKEYWLNVNTEDIYFNTYRQIPIPFQLKNKKSNVESIKMVPSKHYRKTNLFGLFYDIVRDSGNFDFYGIPETEDAFAYTNEEVLIKLFALKKYLKEKFLPLNSRIIDITGEGVYYERYAVNSWNNSIARLEVELGKALDFTHTKRAKIVDLRTYNSLGGLFSPDKQTSISKYINSYDINDVIVLSGGSGFLGEVPRVIFPGVATQQARGRCKVIADLLNETVISGNVLNTPGIGYEVNDIITLRGGSYLAPVRLTVESVDIDGGVLSFSIASEAHRGLSYTSIPESFNGSSVVRLVGPGYIIPEGVEGFTIAADEISFSLEEITLYDLGRGYTTIPEIKFVYNSISPTEPTVELTIVQHTSAPSSYYNNAIEVKPYSDAPEINIGAIIDVEAFLENIPDGYEMEWIVNLSQPKKPNQVYVYKSGIQEISKLTNHTIILPYIGIYDITLEVYDLNNTKSNEIKCDAIEVFMSDSDFSFITKNTLGKIDTWDELEQIIVDDDLYLGIKPLNYPDKKDYVKLTWENLNSRWVNLNFNTTIWDDLDVNWSTLDVSNLSDINFPIFPEKQTHQVLGISFRDVLEGKVILYTDDTTSNPTVNPTITAENQKDKPKVDPLYDPTDWIYIRRDDVIYHLEVLSTSYATEGITKYVLVNKPPTDFIVSHTKWEILREIGGTVIVNGDVIWNEDTNPKGFKVDNYLNLEKIDSTPILYRNIISENDDESFNILNGGNINLLDKIGSYGRVYKIRNYYEDNGNLTWTKEVSSIKKISFSGLATTENVFTDVAVDIVLIGTGTGAKFTVSINDINEYKVSIENAGIGYDAGDSLFIYGSTIGGVDGVNDLTIDIDEIGSSSPWVFYNNNVNDPDVSSHNGLLLFNPYTITCDPLNELEIGFSKIKLFVYDSDVLVYQNEFRSYHGYHDTSNTGDIFNVWGKDAYVIEVEGLDGGNLFDLNNKLTEYFDNNFSIYLEYEYAHFLTRQRFSINDGGDKKLYLDYNVFPPNGNFINSVEFGVLYNSNNSNWFYDHGIASGEYSLKIVNSGIWKDGIGTILVVEDSSAELYRSDTFFVASQQEFDEDYAKKHLGTLVQTWDNYTEITWDQFNGNSWNTLDFTESLYCGFILHDINSNGKIYYNEDDDFSFENITGLMNIAEKYSQAIYELNNQNKSLGLSNFNYTLFDNYQGLKTYILENGQTNFWETVNAVNHKCSINTYERPFLVYYYDDNISINDSLYGNCVLPGNKIIDIDTITLPGTKILELNKELPKKAIFIGNSKNNSNKITLITGILPTDIMVGDIITGNGLPLYTDLGNPAGAKIIELIIKDGIVKEITLDINITAANFLQTFYVENVTAVNTLITIPYISSSKTEDDIIIIASAKSPSNDNLGYLYGDGVSFIPPQLITDNISTDVSHTFPLVNFYNWFGFNENKIGSFEKGINNFLINYRNAQVYLYHGTSPYDTPGWYPANTLDYVYSFENDLAFDNYKEGIYQSNRLPYENSIGGSYTWEEIKCGKNAGKIPAGSNVLFSADASDIAGKSKFIWKMYKDEKLITEILNDKFLWMFEFIGTYDLELTIFDSNGNQNTKMKKSFLTIYEA